MRTLFLMVVFWGTMPFILIDPFYGVVHYTLINIIRPEQLLWGGGVGRIFWGSQAVTFFSWLVNKEKLSPKDTPLPLQMKLLWILGVEMVIVTYTVAYNQDWSWQWTVIFLKTTVLCFVMSKAFNTTKKVERYYVVSLVWLSLLAIWGIQQKFGGNDRMEGLGGTMMPDINGVAAVYVMYLPMAYYSVFSRKKWIKLLIGIPVTILFVVFIIFSSSRGAFLGMIACMGIIFLRSKGTQRIKTIIVLALLVVAFFRFAPPEYYDRLATMLGEEKEETGEVEYEGSAASRVAMWKGAIAVYKNHSEYWFLGVGIQCYRFMYINHIDEIAAVLSERELQYVLFRGGRGGRDMHNTFLNVLLGGGAVMFLTWMFLIFYSWRQVHNIPKKYPKIINGIDIHNYARAVETGIIGFCICALFVSASTIDLFYWYLIMSAILTNLGKAELKREALGQEDEDFEAEVVRKPVYSY